MSIHPMAFTLLGISTVMCYPVNSCKVSSYEKTKLITVLLFIITQISLGGHYNTVVLLQLSVNAVHFLLFLKFLK